VPPATPPIRVAWASSPNSPHVLANGKYLLIISQSAKFISSVNGILQEKQMQTAIRYINLSFVILFLSSFGNTCFLFFKTYLSFVWFFSFIILCFIYFFVSFNCISAAHMHIHVCMLMFMFCTESILQTVVCEDSVESHRNQPKVIATKRIAMPCPSMHITKTKSRLNYPLDMQNFLNSKL